MSPRWPMGRVLVLQPNRASPTKLCPVDAICEQADRYRAEIIAEGRNSKVAHEQGGRANLAEMHVSPTPCLGRCAQDQRTPSRTVNNSPSPPSSDLENHDTFVNFQPSCSHRLAQPAPLYCFRITSLTWRPATVAAFPGHFTVLLPMPDCSTAS